MDFFEVKNDDGWDERVVSWGGDFLQSFWWGDLQSREGRAVRRFVLSENGEVFAQALVIEKNLSFGFKYWYIAHGPLGIDAKFIAQFLKCAVNAAFQGSIFFIHVEPLDNFPKFGEYAASQNKEPRQSLWLNVKDKSLEALLAGMHPKTRYNIKLAQKKGVEVSLGRWSDEIWKLFLKTAQRGGFSLHSREHYELILNDNHAKLLVAKWNGKLLGANIIVLYGNRVVYIHGASSLEHKEMMAPYLLHFYCLGIALKEGFDCYDFWGIDENLWPGVTRFKLGFGGEKVFYPEAYDLILSDWKYNIYKSARGAVKFFKGK